MESTISNPYSYLNKDEFTSELYKIEIKNLHVKVGFSQLKQRLRSIGLNPHKVKIMRDYSFVTFKSAEERDEAIIKVTGHNWKGNVLLAKIAKARADPFLQKRKEMEDDNEATDCKKAKIDEDDRTDEEKFKDHVVKFWRKPYDNQLIAKENKVKGILQQLYQKINRENPLVKEYKNYYSEVEGANFACPLMPIIRSPIENDYRNKCEFTIGMTLDKQGPIAGFCHGKYRGGHDAVGDARILPIIPEKMTVVLGHINELLPTLISEEFSPRLSILTSGTDQGHLRGITLRTGSLNLDDSTDKTENSSSLLMIVDIHPQNLSESDIEKICQFFAEYFTTGNGKTCGITSLLLTLRRNNADALDLTTTRIVVGSGFVYEKLMNLDFRISFNAFFQVNTLAAEVLYSTIRKMLSDHLITKETKNNVTLLDVCCGTGTIGLAMADLVESVIGVEMCAESVKDANYNKELNKITNARFQVGKAEDLLSNILLIEERNTSDSIEREFVAIVDPPRAGLHSNVIQALRRCEFVKKVIFVSCNPEAAYNNFVEFARPISKRTHGCPFIPEIAIPVDLFPHTPHVELVMLLTRLRPL